MEGNRTKTVWIVEETGLLSQSKEVNIIKYVDGEKHRMAYFSKLSVQQGCSLFLAYMFSM